MVNTFVLFVLTIILSACPAGIAPLVGYPTKNDVQATNVIFDDTFASGNHVRILRKSITYKYSLLFSPEGGKKNYDLKRGFRYFIIENEKDEKPLSFLDDGPDGNPDKIIQIYSLEGGGILGALGESDSKKTNDYHSYFIVKFTENRIIHKSTFEVCKGSKPEYIESLKSIKFCGVSGEMLYRWKDNSYVKSSESIANP